MFINQSFVTSKNTPNGFCPVRFRAGDLPRWPHTIACIGVWAYHTASVAPTHTMEKTMNNTQSIRLRLQQVREEIDAIDIERGVVAVDRPTDADVLERQQEVLRVEQERLEGRLGLIEAYHCACRDVDDLEKRAARLYAEANFHRDRGERNLAALSQKQADALAAERATLQTIRAQAYEALFKAGIL